MMYIAISLCIIFLTLIIYFSTFNYVEISGSSLKFKWFRGEKSINMKNISAFYHFSGSEGNSPLYKVEKPIVIGALYTLIYIDINAVFITLKISLILRIVILAFLIATIFPILLPANTGRRVLPALFYSNCGYISVLVLIWESNTNPFSAISYIMITSSIIMGFLVGYYLGSLRELGLDCVIIKTFIDDKERVVIINMRADEMRKFKEALINVMSEGNFS